MVVIEHNLDVVAHVDDDAGNRVAETDEAGRSRMANLRPDRGRRDRESGGGDGRQSGNHPNRARKGDRHLSVPSPGRRASRNASRAEDPGFTIRAAQVLTRFPGASPERIEQLVTDPIEEAIQELPEIDFISSTSKTEWST